MFLRNFSGGSAVYKRNVFHRNGIYVSVVFIGFHTLTEMCVCEGGRERKGGWSSGQK